MSEETTEQTSEGKETAESGDLASLLTNHKAETDRKLGNVSEQINELKDFIQQQVKSAQPAKVEPEIPPTSLADLAISDPDRFEKEMEARIDRRVDQKATTIQRNQQDTLEVFNRISARYPEIADVNSDVYKDAQKILGKRAPQGEPTAEQIELSLMQAIQDKGILPLEMRRDLEDDDGGYMGSSSGGRGSNERSRRNKKADNERLNENTLALAKLMGFNTSDPKYLERLKEIQKSRAGNWGKYR